MPVCASYWTPKLAGVLLLGITLAVFQQWCGINVIFNYAADVFAAAGYNVSDILLNMVITGAVNLIFTFVAIAMVDGAGRRKLMLFGSAALALIYTALGIGFHMHGQGLYMLCSLWPLSRAMPCPSRPSPGW